ncbi:MAG TPA: GNAT family N-acetyltransferase [Solirubrobacter sp.]|nr:GNAT family N-acetyltransferase [Solirubrobacter sp.]
MLYVADRPALDAASLAAHTTLLNCYLREGGAHAFDGDTLVIGALRAELAHRSAFFHHRFRGPACEDGRPLDVASLAERLARALDPAADPAPLLERVRASLASVATVLEARADDVERLWSAEPLTFEETEQALLLGHPLHPTPKGLSGRLGRYTPELRPRFQLHWLSVNADLVAHDSATGTPAPELAARLRGRPAPRGRVLLPAHPWEAGYLARAAAPLFASGDVVDLGPDGAPVTPTTSVRTVYRARWPYMLKFSLHARVTNSMRVTLPKELRRAVEAQRLAQTAVGEAARRIAPHFTILHDPAYLSVPGEDGFSVLFRENRWPALTDVSAVTVLCQDHPFGGRSRASALARDPRAWFARYLDVTVVSLIRLYLDLGLCFEPHQQNTLLELRDGLPERCVVRDSQGYFHREAAHADLTRIIPGLGETSESIFPEALADERLVYYPFVNNALGVIDALRDRIDERVLLADLRTVLERERAAGGRYPHTLLDRLLDDDLWPCKANLRTRINDMDELVGDIAEQSVYVKLPNPLRPPIELVPAERHAGALAGWLAEPHVAEWWGSGHAPPPHVEPWVATVDGVPFAYVETYAVADDPLAAHYDARPGDRGFHLLVGADWVGTGVPRALLRVVLERFAGHRVVCEPDVRNARMLAFCRALGGEVRATLELPDKRAALVVWE